MTPTANQPKCISRLVPNQEPAVAATPRIPVRHPRHSLRAERPNLFRSLSRPWLVASLLLLSLALLTWSYLARRASVPMPPRALADDAPDPGTLPAPEQVDLAPLRQTAGEALARLVANRDEFKALLARVETTAREAGWRPELTVSPPQPASASQPSLVAYPVDLQLLPARTNSPPRYTDLVRWLRRLATLEPPVEVVLLRVKGDPAELGEIRVELRVLGRNPHETIPPS